MTVTRHCDKIKSVIEMSIHIRESAIVRPMITPGGEVLPVGP